MAEPDPERDGATGREAAGREATSSVGFRTRLTLVLIATAILPLAAFAAILTIFELAVGAPATDSRIASVLLFAAAVIVVVAVFASFGLADQLTRPLRTIAAAVDRVSSGHLDTPIRVAGEDELARLADSHNRLAADLSRRNRELDRILSAIGDVSPRDDVERIIERTSEEGTRAFELIDAVVVMGDPRQVEEEEVVPGVSRPLRAVLRAGGEDLGVLIGRAPATRRWERADQDLLELFASQMAAAIRNAQLFATIERQNRQLRELDAVKDDFLRGVSHNLQTPLTSIRAYAEQLGAAAPDRRLGIIAEQSERLSRMVRQLLTVTRLESGALRPRSEVMSLTTRVRRAWEALGADGVEFQLEDGAGGWLAIADPDQLDQVLWALLDNAVKYGGGAPVSATIEAREEAQELHLTIRDGGPGIPPEDRDRLFARFSRGMDAAADGGSGLGLYVSRELCRAMGGELVLAADDPGRPGAAFTVILAGEPGAES